MITYLISYEHVQSGARKVRAVGRTAGRLVDYVVDWLVVAVVVGVVVRSSSSRSSSGSARRRNSASLEFRMATYSCTSVLNLC